MLEIVECYIGISGSGKTSRVIEKCDELSKQGKKIGGIITLGNFKNDQRYRFWVKNLKSEKSMLLAERDMSSSLCQGAFGFSLEAIDFGNACVREAIVSNVDVLVIDEIGPLELQEKGWFSCLQEVKKVKIPQILFTSRPSTFTAICDVFFPNKEIKKC